MDELSKDTLLRATLQPKASKVEWHNKEVEVEVA